VSNVSPSMYLPVDAPILDIHVKAWYGSMRGCLNTMILKVKMIDSV